MHSRQWAVDYLSTQKHTGSALWDPVPHARERRQAVNAYCAELDPPAEFFAAPYKLGLRCECVAPPEGRLWGPCRLIRTSRARLKPRALAEEYRTFVENILEASENTPDLVAHERLRNVIGS